MVMVMERWNQNGERVVLGDHHMHGPIPSEVDVASSRRRLVLYNRSTGRQGVPVNQMIQSQTSSPSLCLLVFVLILY